MAKCDLNAVIQVAKNEVGYLEKKSNKQLDHKTANAGKNNYTKYNRDYEAWDEPNMKEIPDGSINMQWCASFVSWCFVNAYGMAAAIKLLCGGLHCYTPTGAGRFKNRGQYIKRGKGMPKRGDVVFFWNSSKGRIGHVGIVYKVTGSRVYTIEGNTSGASTLVTNGGGVCKKSYNLTSTYIDGYGRPDYAAVEAGTGATVALELGDRLLTNGCEGDDVKELQEALVQLGYGDDLGVRGTDGDFGDCTEMAVMHFQREHGCDADGEYGPITHKAMTAALEKLGKPVENPKRVKIVGGNCWIRSEPNTGGDKLDVAKRDSVHEYAGETAANGWLKIDKGWVSGKYGVLVS